MTKSNSSPHWIGVAMDDDVRRIFDVNATCVGGWISEDEWSLKLVPWLLKEVEPKASGGWHLTHSVEIERAASSGRP
jgi:hypothetical protein